MQPHAYCYLAIGPPPGVKSISDISRVLGSVVYLPVILLGVQSILVRSRLGTRPAPPPRLKIRSKSSKLSCLLWTEFL